MYCQVYDTLTLDVFTVKNIYYRSLNTKRNLPSSFHKPFIYLWLSFIYSQKINTVEFILLFCYIKFFYRTNFEVIPDVDTFL